MASTLSQRHRSWRMNLLVVVLLLVVAAMGYLLWSLTRSGEPFAPGVRAFRQGGIAFAYPAGWNVHDAFWGSVGLGSTLAILGTQPWGLCLPMDLNCHYQLRLEPSQISVELSSGQMLGEDVCAVGVDRTDLAGRGPGDPPAQGRLMRVDGRPTLQTDYAVNQRDYYHADEWRSWVIAAPGGTVATYTVFAQYRGPGVPVFRQQLDDLIASIRFVVPPPLEDPGPQDCGAPFP
jgi:hypothetical protein